VKFTRMQLRRRVAHDRVRVTLAGGVRVKTLLCAALMAMVPTAAFAEDTLTTPAVDQPAAAQPLVPKEAPETAQPAVQEAARCGMHGCCAGRARRGGGLILVGVAGTILTAVAIGVAVGVARSAQTQAVQR
jgi:hypothetical protein